MAFSVFVGGLFLAAKWTFHRPICLSCRAMEKHYVIFDTIMAAAVFSFLYKTGTSWREWGLFISVDNQRRLNRRIARAVYLSNSKGLMCSFLLSLSLSLGSS